MKTKEFWNTLLISAFLIIAVLITVPKIVNANTFDYSIYNRVLDAYVDEKGLVNYKAMKANPDDLEVFLEQIKNLTKDAYKTWSNNQKIAFWVNAYNALTLKVIIDHYPIKASGFSSLAYPKNSIRQISGAWTRIQFNVIGEMVTLDQIEHKILRKEFSNPGIHMALVCAALSCPYLRQEAYTGDKLEMQFKDQSRRFLAGEKGLVINQKQKRVSISSIFKWFAADFKKQYGKTTKYQKYSDKQRAILNFIASFTDKQTIGYLEQEKYSIDYLHYDWTLNEQQGK